MTNQMSICIHCGEFKPYALDACAHCGFEPISKDDKAKSFALSLAFDVGEESFGRLMPELVEISGQIRSGKPFAFDPSEVKVVRTSFEVAESVSPFTLLFEVVKWLFVPGVLTVLVILQLIYG